MRPRFATRRTIPLCPPSFLEGGMKRLWGIPPVPHQRGFRPSGLPNDFWNWGNERFWGIPPLAPTKSRRVRIWTPQRSPAEHYADSGKQVLGAVGGPILSGVVPWAVADEVGGRVDVVEAKGVVGDSVDDRESHRRRGLNGAVNQMGRVAVAKVERAAQRPHR